MVTANDLRTKLEHTVAKSTRKWRSQHAEAVWTGTNVTGHGWIFSQEYQAFPSPCSYDKSYPVPREIERWQMMDIKACSDALEAGHLKIEVFTGPSMMGRRAAAANAPSVDSTNAKSPPVQQSSLVNTPTKKGLSRSDRLRTLVRERLLDTIRKAIGRDIVPRSKQPINPKLDNEEPPNLYKWQFSPNYPSFPDMAVTRWTMKAHEACLEALSQGWLSVVALHAEEPASGENEGTEYNAASQRQSSRNSHAQVVDNNSVEEHASDEAHDVIDALLDTIRYHDLEGMVISLAEDARVGGDIPSLQEALADVECVIRRRECAIEGVAELLEIQKRSLSSVKDDIVKHAQERASSLEQIVKDKSLQYEKLKANYEELQKELFRTSEEISDLKQKVEHPLDEVAEARRLGEIEDLRTAIQDLRDERDAQFQRHLTQLKRAREDSWQKGYQECEASVTKKICSSVELTEAKEKITSLNQQLEDVQTRHVLEITKAREQARRENEELSHLLVLHNVKPGSRKAREMRAIYHNWNNIPQNILPKSMMPEGIEPSDRILILLARLSRIENDSLRATALLEREIDHRNRQLPEARRDTTVTNADISKVLASLRQQEPISDESPSQNASEMSATPQPTLRHAMRSALDSDRSPNLERLPSARESDSEPTSRRHLISRINLGNSSGDSADQFSKIRSSVAKNQAFVENHCANDINSHRRSYWGNAINQATSLTSQTRVPGLSLMPDGCTEVHDGRIRAATPPVISEEIGALPLILKSLIPSSLQEFPLDFVNKYIGGNNETFTQDSRAMRDKVVVDWTEMIRINPEYHPQHPSKGCHGALTIVDGRAKSGEIGKIYPTLLKSKVGYLQYIGHYKVVKRIIMPVETWISCTDDERYAVAEEIEDRKWGQAVLKSKGLSMNSAGNQGERIATIQGFFERYDEPWLRMNWTLLQFVSFEQEEYNLLLSALKESETDEAEIGEAGIEDAEIDEAEINEDVSSVASKVMSRRVSGETTDKPAMTAVQHQDELHCSRRGNDTPDGKHSDNCYALMAKQGLQQSNRDINKLVKIATNTSPVRSALASYDVRSALKVPASDRSTIPSSTNDSNDCASPEYLSPTKDGRWGVHANSSQQAADFAASNSEPLQDELSGPSVSIKRPYAEDQVDLYGVSPPPPPKIQPSVSAQVKVVRAPTRTSAQILASFINAKRRRLG